MIAAALAFVGVICLFSVNSYSADEYNLNLFLTIAACIFLTASFVWISYEYLKQK